MKPHERLAVVLGKHEAAIERLLAGNAHEVDAVAVKDVGKDVRQLVNWADQIDAVAIRRNADSDRHPESDAVDYVRRLAYSAHNSPRTEFAAFCKSMPLLEHWLKVQKSLVDFEKGRGSDGFFVRTALGGQDKYVRLKLIGAAKKSKGYKGFEFNKAQEYVAAQVASHRAPVQDFLQSFFQSVVENG